LLLVAGGLAVVAVAAIAWNMSRKDEAARQRIIDTESTFRDATLVQALTYDDAAIHVAEQTAVQTSDAAVAVIAEHTADAGVTRVRPHPQDHDRVGGSAAGSGSGRAAGSASGSDGGSGSAIVIAQPPSVGKRKATINSKPWSNFTVDGGAQHTSPETIELAPGVHTIHFTGQPYFKADKTVTITVPDRDGFTYFQKLEETPESPAPAP
jgi:hypothetical protein